LTASKIGGLQTVKETFYKRPLLYALASNLKIIGLVQQAVKAVFNRKG
jgi:hypothetical protein